MLACIVGGGGATAWLLLDTSSNAAEPAEWLEIPPQSLYIEANSPLDFSRLFPVGYAGRAGPLAVIGGSTLAFRDSPAPVKFNCAMIQSGFYQHSPFPTHEEADQFARQLKLHGYNLVRFQYIEYRLLQYARTEVEVDPEQLDRFRYFLLALKNNGIYWAIDVITTGARGLTGSELSRSPSSDDLRKRLHFDPVARQLWIKMLDTVFASQNPYTGKSILRDPALAFVVGANENSLDFGVSSTRPYPTGLDVRFSEWLHQHYPTPKLLHQVIPDLDPFEMRSSSLISVPALGDTSSYKAVQFRLFTSSLELDTYNWMREELTKRGFNGPMLAYHDWYRQIDNRVRASLPVTDVHAYVGNVSSEEAGSSFSLPDPVQDKGLGDFLTNFAARWLDKPMVTTEYSVPFPNPNRYEGFLYPTLAAFQGFSTVCRTAFTAVEPSMPPASAGYKPLRAYVSGLDPNERAQETLSTVLFYRGDIKRGTHIVAVPFGAKDFERTGSAYIPLRIRRAALLARFGLIAPEKLATLPGAVVAPLTPEAESTAGKILSRMGNMITGSGDAQTIALVDALRKEGALSPGNPTDPTVGVFQSETGEITLDQRKGMISVVTPRTEAVSVTNAADAIKLGRMTVQSVDAGALVAATALDDEPLATSRKILFIMTGDTKNTGMQLDGDPRAPRLVTWGRLPILMRRIVADVDLRTAGGRGGKLTVLSLQGTPLSSSSVFAKADGTASLQLDTGAVRDMPTTYFLYEPTR